VNKLEYRDRAYLIAALPKTRDDPTKYLPEEVMLHVFHYLSPRELGVAARVSKRWNLIGETNHLWKMCYQKRNWTLPMQNVPWKMAFMHNFMTHKNWLQGKARLTNIEYSLDMVIAISPQGQKCYSNGVVKDAGGIILIQRATAFTAAKFREDKLVTGDKDGWLSLFDLNLKILAKSRRIGHHEISSILWINDRIITGEASNTCIHDALAQQIAFRQRGRSGHCD